MQQGFWKSPAAIAMILTILVSGYAASRGFIEVSLQELTGAKVGTVFLALIFTALVIERAVEVYVNNRYDPEEMQIQRGIRAEQQELKLLEETLAVEIARVVTAGDDAAEKQDEVKKLRADIAKARKAVLSQKVAALDTQIDLETRKKAAAGAVATLIGVVAAAAGIRVLGQFLPVDTNNHMIGPLAQTCAKVAADATATQAMKDGCDAVDFQLTAFRFADVLLTAMLLAGGADGIHQIVKDFLSKKNDLKPTS